MPSQRAWRRHRRSGQVISFDRRDARSDETESVEWTIQLAKRGARAALKRKAAADDSQESSADDSQESSYSDDMSEDT